MAKHSGGKRGISLYRIDGSSVTVSPMLSSDWPTKPTMSPAHASSMVSRSRPNSFAALESRIVFPLWAWIAVMSRVNFPEQIRRNATRSRWRGSIFA